MNRYHFREARAADAPRLAVLAGHLGYPATVDEIEARLPFLLPSPDHLLLVATDDDDLAVGWVHALLRHTLASDPFVQVASLVVDADHRSRGIGAQLLARAEEWAARAAVGEVRVRSNIVRERAHAFYLREGYDTSKTSLLFVKELRKPGRTASD